jgi:hypothetical protein
MIRIPPAPSAHPTRLPSARVALATGILLMCTTGLSACGGGSNVSEAVPKSTPDIIPPTDTSAEKAAVQSTSTSTTGTTSTGKSGESSSSSEEEAKTGEETSSSGSSPSGASESSESAGGTSAGGTAKSGGEETAKTGGGSAAGSESPATPSGGASAPTGK